MARTIASTLAGADELNARFTSGQPIRAVDIEKYSRIENAVWASAGAGPAAAAFVYRDDLLTLTSFPSNTVLSTHILCQPRRPAWLRMFVQASAPVSGGNNATIDFFAVDDGSSSSVATITTATVYECKLYITSNAPTQRIRVRISDMFHYIRSIYFEWVEQGDDGTAWPVSQGPLGSGLLTAAPLPAAYAADDFDGDASQAVSADMLLESKARVQALMGLQKAITTASWCQLPGTHGYMPPSGVVFTVPHLPEVENAAYQIHLDVDWEDRFELWITREDDRLVDVFRYEELTSSGSGQITINVPRETLQPGVQYSIYTTSSFPMPYDLGAGPGGNALDFNWMNIPGGTNPTVRVYALTLGASLSPGSLALPGDASLYGGARALGSALQRLYAAYRILMGFHCRRRVTWWCLGAAPTAEYDDPAHAPQSATTWIPPFRVYAGSQLGWTTRSYIAIGAAANNAKDTFCTVNLNGKVRTRPVTMERNIIQPPLSPIGIVTGSLWKGKYDTFKAIENNSTPRNDSGLQFISIVNTHLLCIVMQEEP